MDDKVTSAELARIKAEADTLTLGQCFRLALETHPDAAKKIYAMAQAIVDLGRELEANGPILTAACAYVCINQVVVDHKDDTKGFFHA